MKKILLTAFILFYIVSSCASMNSCEALEVDVNTGIQYVYGEMVCGANIATSSIYTVQSHLIYDKMLYITVDMRVYESERREQDIQTVWTEAGTLKEDTLDFRFITDESVWAEGHSLQHITENVERTYSLLTDENATMYLILLKDRTAYLAFCTNNAETVYTLEETEISYYEDIKRPSYEIFTYSVTAKDEEFYLSTSRVLCLYNNQTGFFLQCAENDAGGIYGTVTKSADGMMLESNDGKYKIAVDTSDENWSFNAESPERLKFTDNIESGTGSNVRKIGEYYNFLEEALACFDSWEYDFDGNGKKESITFHHFPYGGITPLLSSLQKSPSHSVNAAVWENGEIKYFVFLPFEHRVSDIRFYEDSGELFAEVDEIKYERKHYSGVALPDYAEEINETVIYKVTADESGLAFTKTE